MTYWLREKDNKIHVFIVLIFLGNLLVLSISVIALQTLPSDHILLWNFILSNPITLMEDLISGKRGCEIFLIGRYAGNIENKNIVVKY